MGMAMRHGLMVHPMMVSMIWGRSMEKVCLLGQMAVPTKEISKITISKGEVNTIGQMGESSKVNGLTTKWKALEHSHGLMAASI